MLERSLHARFLIPMAVSLAFGVGFATFVTLLVVPTLTVAVEDFKSFIKAPFGARSKKTNKEQIS